MSDDSWRSKYVAMKKLYIDTKVLMFKHFGGQIDFELKGVDFVDGGMLNKKHASTGTKCGEGDNIFPTIEWTGLPNGTKSLALIVEDPDASKGKPTQREPWVHLIAWNIDPEYKNLDNGTVTEMVKTGKNSFGEQGYNGPCPPAGDQPHHYHFKLYALNRQLDLKQDTDATVDDLRNAINAPDVTVLGEAEIVGLYGVQTT